MNRTVLKVSFAVGLLLVLASALGLALRHDKKVATVPTAATTTASPTVVERAGTATVTQTAISETATSPPPPATASATVLELGPTHATAHGPHVRHPHTTHTQAPGSSASATQPPADRYGILE